MNKENLTVLQSNTAERWRTISAIYLSGLLQGIALVLFPAAGLLLTDPDFYGLSSSQFGVLFTPQLIMAIVASVLASRLAQNFGMKRVFQLGLIANLMAMVLLAASQLVIGVGEAAFIVLLFATGSIGAGFGFTITALNAYAFALFPGREDSAVTGLHVLTGSGQAGAALTLGAFLSLGVWWGAPLTIGLLLLLMILFQSGLALRLATDTPTETRATSQRLPLRIWLFALVTFAYGAIEGTFGNWTPIYLETSAGLSASEAALGLTLFWISVTFGRVIFALLAVRINTKPLYYVSPFMIVAVFLLLPTLQGVAAHFTAMVVAGLAASFYFPYTISLASAENPSLTAAVSGLLVAAFQLGFGVSANIIGFANESVDLTMIFRLSAFWPAVIALVVIYLGLSLVRKDGSGLDRRLPCLVLPCTQNHQKELENTAA